MIFLDTCILIDYSKDKITIKSEDKEDYCFSSIVQLEFKTIDIDQDILDLSVRLANTYTLSHNMTIYDAIIAATCLIYDLPLWTHNKKDFRYLTELELELEE